MYSIPPLNLLPPQPPQAAAPTPPPPAGDGSFGSTLKRAQDRNANPSDDGTQTGQTAQSGQPTGGDVSSKTAAGSTAADDTDRSAESAESSESSDGSDAADGKAGRPDGLKKPAAAKSVRSGEQADTADESDGQSDTDAEEIRLLAGESVEAAVSKQPKKTPVKPAPPKATPAPIVANQPAAGDLKPKKVDSSKQVASDSAGKTGRTNAATGGKVANAEPGESDADSEVGDVAGGDAGGVDGAETGKASVGKVGGQRSFGSKLKPAGGQNESGNAAANAVAAAEAAGVAAGAESESETVGSGGVVAAIGTATDSADKNDDAAAALAADAASGSGKTDATDLTAVPAVKPTPQQQFVEENHPKIVSGVAGELLPDGGTMQIRLDPPELGTISVTIHMKAGVMSAAFETSNDDSTRMLTHSLSQLKTSLEATGVSVEKMQVQQSTKQEGKGTGDKDSGQDSGAEKQQDAQGQAKRDQQRQDMIKRMWAKLAGGDPLDLVA